MVFGNWLGNFADRINSNRGRRSRRRGLSRQRHEISAPVEVFEDRTLLASTPVLNITSPPPSNVDEGNSISVAGTVTQTGSEDINVYIRWDDDGATGSSSPWYSDLVQVPSGNSFSSS